jgi:hypothetical protein
MYLAIYECFFYFTTKLINKNETFIHLDTFSGKIRLHLIESAFHVP